MKKLKLDLDGLAVDSFATLAGTAHRGTVDGREPRPTLETICGSTWLVSNPTCRPCTPRYQEG
ncbi:MAG TPA: hypothetical protein VF746_06785 [Longimicrobium sp.]|jgi:hypothetical protein